MMRLLWDIGGYRVDMILHMKCNCALRSIWELSDYCPFMNYICISMYVVYPYLLQQILPIFVGLFFMEKSYPVLISEAIVWRISMQTREIWKLPRPNRWWQWLYRSHRMVHGTVLITAERKRMALSSASQRTDWKGPFTLTNVIFWRYRFVEDNREQKIPSKLCWDLVPNS